MNIQKRAGVVFYSPVDASAQAEPAIADNYLSINFEQLRDVVSVLHPFV